MGIHVGEVELRGDHTAGAAVDVAARIVREAAGGEIVVSRTVRDLTAGTDLRFEDRGTHRLEGIADDWQLYAVA